MVLQIKIVKCSSYYWAVLGLCESTIIILHFWVFVKRNTSSLCVNFKTRNCRLARVDLDMKISIQRRLLCLYKEISLFIFHSVAVI